MSASTNKPENGSNAAFNWTNGIAESLRDFVSLQFRAAQFAMDKNVSLGQAVTEFYQNQMNESLKLTQECAKYSWGLTENLKKTAFEATDRAFRGVSA